jgi:hypothetical protein
MKLVKHAFRIAVGKRCLLRRHDSLGREYHAMQRDENKFN